jgi:hypothetical protein
MFRVVIVAAAVLLTGYRDSTTTTTTTTIVGVHGLAAKKLPKPQRYSTGIDEHVSRSRRSWFKVGATQLLGGGVLILVDPNLSGAAATTDASNVPQQQQQQQQEFDPSTDDDPEIRELYSNPAIPQAPEERSGLVVLRVAEVAQFQEKILRAVVSGELQGVTVSPMQFAFGTQILLRNSGIDSNMKLMINEEIPRSKRPKAIKNAVAAMNTLQEIGKFSASIQRDFEKDEMIKLADMYLAVRVNLNQLYEYLPEKEREKYYGYFMAVTEYEKKIADGVYNPDIDGVLNLEY